MISWSLGRLAEYGSKSLLCLSDDDAAAVGFGCAGLVALATGDVFSASGYQCDIFSREAARKGQPVAQLVNGAAAVIYVIGSIGDGPDTSELAAASGRLAVGEGATP